MSTEDLYKNTFFNVADYYEEVDLRDFVFDAKRKIFTYPCPCGDQFEIGICELISGEEIAYCASCPLIVRVIYEDEDIEKLEMIMNE